MARAITEVTGFRQPVVYIYLYNNNNNNNNINVGAVGVI